MNKFTKIISFGTVVIIVIFLIVNLNPEPVEEITVGELLKKYFSSHVIKKSNNLDFDTYFTKNDIIRHNQKLQIQDEVRFEL